MRGGLLFPTSVSPTLRPQKQKDVCISRGRQCGDDLSGTGVASMNGANQEQMLVFVDNPISALPLEHNYWHFFFNLMRPQSEGYTHTS